MTAFFMHSSGKPMKYFKHMSTMSEDTKIKRVRRKYGLKGYGLYCLMIEYISRQLDKHSPLPDLQEHSEDIADEWGIDIREVEEMMLFFTNEGLFEINECTGRLMCLKLEKYLDEYLTKVPEIREAINQYKMYLDYENPTEMSEKSGDNGESDFVGVTPDNVGFCHPRIEENRREENILEQKRTEENKLETAKAVIDKLNEITNRSYRYTNNNLKHVNARLREGFAIDDFVTVIEFKNNEWSKDPDMYKYIRPSTLFGGKFEGYLQSASHKQDAPARAAPDDLFAEKSRLQGVCEKCGGVTRKMSTENKLWCARCDIKYDI